MSKQVTTIEQHQGEHHTGMRIVALLDVRTERGDWMGDAEYEAMHAEDRAMFARQLARLHAARVAIESLDADPRRIAHEREAELAQSMSSELDDAILAAETALAESSRPAASSGE